MYRLTDEQPRYVRQVAAIADKSIAPRAARIDRDRGFPHESMATLEGGLVGLTRSSASGGFIGRALCGLEVS